MKTMLFVISQLYKGGAEPALVNLLNRLDYAQNSVELLILNQVPVEEAVSLIDKVNSKVKICNAYEESKKITIFERLRMKLLYTEEQKNHYFSAALDFVRGKQYDWAFFIGEWCSPAFVAIEVNAKQKAAWIHCDISKAQYFDPNVYFHYLDCFDYFIFASQHSLDSSVEKYPFLKDKAVTVYNISDIVDIKKKAEEVVEDFEKPDIPMLLTCANFRSEKNHLRQVEVLAELKKRNVDCVWVNIGSTSDVKLVEKVRQKCREYQIEDRFLILGPKSNPYKYIRMADMVTVLSDYESWSMVITEAKILGKPVVSTRTSGALEQIIDRETGVLTEFDVTSIADVIEEIIKNLELRKKIEKQISNFDNTDQVMKTFESLLKRTEKKENDLLYVIDDINYVGGAHSATKLQIKDLLEKGRVVTVFSSTVPNLKVRNELVGVKFLSLRDSSANTLYCRRISECLIDKQLSHSEKKRKIRYTIRGYQKKLDYDREVLWYTKEIFSKYPRVCVMSESSVYRKIVAYSSAKTKIQWIHTDYSGWYKYSTWTSSITAEDNEIYQKFDKIVVLTDSIKTRFSEIYPELASKLVVNRNLIPMQDIKGKAQPVSVKNENPVNFVTVGRIEAEKEFPRLIRILGNLKEEGYRFTWTIIGDGSQFKYVEELVKKYDLNNEVTMTGALDNPYRKMIQADVFALLSSYEGLPNTIYEALILDIPVLATNVGGIVDQVKNGENGWIVESNETCIADKICYLLMNQKEILNIKENLKNYVYDNDEIRKNNDIILG